MTPSLVDSEYPGTRRWYDSLRDHYVDRTPRNPFYPGTPFNTGAPSFNATGGDNSSIFSNISSIYQFMKDYWYIGAIVSGVIINSF